MQKNFENKVAELGKFMHPDFGLNISTEITKENILGKRLSHFGIGLEM